MSKKRPSFTNLFLEPVRRFMAATALEQSEQDIVAATVDGDGAPVLVLPGFSMGDQSTASLRSFIDAKNYKSYGWRQGANKGPKAVQLTALSQRLQDISAAHDGQKVTLIGYSLGGMYARELARQYPDLVAQVITIASPFGADESMNIPLKPLRRLSEVFDEAARGMTDSDLVARSLSPLPVPTTAIYSRQDGIVYWQAAINDAADRTENIEISASHLGMLVDPAVRLIIADRLAQDNQNWQSFDRASYPQFADKIIDQDYVRPNSLKP